MPGPKTNEREGTRAVVRYVRISPYKLRQVIDTIREKPVEEAADLLRFLERDAALVVEKLLRSAVANASNNDHLDPEELYVSACYVDEGPTAKRWRPRARGRATRIRKRSSHVTLIVSRLPEERLARLQARRRAENLSMRARRVEATRRARAGGAEGQSRRQRRHPETVPATEGPAGEEELSAVGPTSAEEALLSEVEETEPAEDETEVAPTDETASLPEVAEAAGEPEIEPEASDGVEARGDDEAEASPVAEAPEVPPVAEEATGGDQEQEKDS